jgi:hypothetical protein
MTKEKLKICFAILVALSFILPAGSILATNGQDQKAGTMQIDQFGSFGQGALTDCEISISDINLLGQMAPGPHQITVELFKHCFVTPEPDCCVKLFLDVYKLDPLPNEQIYCTDFEDPGDIYNHWETYDGVNPDGDGTGGVGGIDTFCWSDARSHSPTHSYRCTQFADHYLGNQYDFLETSIENPEDPDNPGTYLYDEIEVQFWHWMEGELLEDAGDPSGSGVAEDYGELYYTTNPALPMSAWTQVPDTTTWTDTEDEDTGDIIWMLESGNVSGTSSIDELWFRWVWKSGPVVQHEGWYIDDVCFYGRQMPNPDFLWQSHSLEEICLTDTYTNYTFPKTWNAEDGTYLFEIWMINETWGCDVMYPQAHKFNFTVEVGCFVDLSIISNIPNGVLFNEGDDLVVESCITNLGTCDATDVPLKFTIEQTVTEKTTDYVEGGFYDVEGQKGGYDPYGEDGVYGLINGVDFNDPDQEGAWHIENDFLFSSPTHAWASFDPVTKQQDVGRYDCIAFQWAASDGTPIIDGFDITDWEKPIDFDLKFDINTRHGTSGNGIIVGLVYGNSWLSLSSSIDTTETAGFETWSMKDMLSGYFGYSPDNPTLPGMAAALADIVYGKELKDWTGMFVCINGGGYGLGTNAVTPVGAWSGAMIDNWVLETTKATGIVFEKTIIIPEIKAETPSDPADVICLDDCDSLVWEDMPTGNYVETKTVPLDDPDEDDPINADNELSNPFKVYTDITSYSDCDIEHYDLSVPAEDVNHWHIDTSEYDRYLCCFETDPDNDAGTETGMYGPDWNDLVLLKADEDFNTHDESAVSMDMNGLAAFRIVFDSFEDFEGDPFDPGWLEVNPHVSESGSHWYKALYLPYGVVPGFGYYQPFWQNQDFVVTPFDLWSDEKEDWYDILEGTSFTDDMGIRFRFESDGSWEYRGWLIDDLMIEDPLAAEAIYEENPCNNMDRFVLDFEYSGDWWHEEPGLGTPDYLDFTCQNELPHSTLGYVIPNNVDCALVWETSVPQALEAYLTFDFDYALEPGGDFCYLEFSTNGGSTWVSPKAYSGGAVGTEDYDISQWAGDDLLIRWRVITNETGRSSHFSIGSLSIYGQVDTTPPVSSATLSGTVVYGWYSSAVTISITASDDIAGVANIYYKIDGGSQLTYTGPITINQNGEHYVEYWAVDKVGNEETPHHFTPTFKIDTGAGPTVSIDAPTPGLYLFGNKLLDMSKTIIIGGFTVQASASDADSGVYMVTFQLDGTTFGEAATAPYTAYCGVKHTGAGTITAIAEDFTGQTAQDTLDVTYFKFL